MLHATTPLGTVRAHQFGNKMESPDGIAATVHAKSSRDRDAQRIDLTPSHPLQVHTNWATMTGP
jgi:hypothetical protein